MKNKAKKKEEKMFQLTVTENQLVTIKCALEEYFRIRLCQCGDLADEICAIGLDFSQENPDHNKIFDMYLQKRDNCKRVLETGIRIAVGDMGIREKTETMLIAEEIWGVIRHEQWKQNPDRLSFTVDACPPIQLSEEPLAKCDRIK